MAAACDRRATGNQKRRNCSIHAGEDGLVSVVPDLGRWNLRIVRWKAVERSRTPPGDAKTSIVRERPARDLLCFERPPARRGFIGASLDILAIATAIAQRVPFLAADKRFGSATGAHFALRWPGPLSGNP